MIAASDMLSNNIAIQNYKELLKRVTSLTYPSLYEEEIEKAVNYSINKRYKEIPASVYNNYTNKTINMNIAELTNYIISREPICTASGVMFKKHGAVPNPLTKMIAMFMDNRNIHKKEMFKYPKGSEMFEKYNLLQLLDKIDCNAIYGALGMNSCMFYNLHVASSITRQGRSLISSATMFFEMFLSNNVKFASLNEIITFIDNVCSENKRRKYNDKDILDKNIDVVDCFAKLVYTCGDFRKGKIKWLPDETDLDIIWNILNRLPQEDINRIYYKNNLYEFMDNTSMSKSLVYILKKMSVPFLDPNEVPDDIKIELDALTDIVKEYVYYGYQIIDRIDRCDNMIKNVSVISDTDSAIVSFDAWYRFVLDKVKGEDIQISKMYVDAVDYTDPDENGNRALFKAIRYEDNTEEDFDFYNDEIIEKYRLRHPLEIIPQDNLRYSIINIIAYIMSTLSNDYMINYTQQSHSYAEGKQCLIILKNEYLFKRALLTMNKKNYATIQELQEGNRVPSTGMKDLDIKGLPINKSTLNESVKKELKKILYEDVLKADKIDQITIIKKLAIVEKKIFNSLSSGEKEYLKPAVIKSLSNYDDPMRIQGIKASLVWNIIRDDDLEAIDLDSRNSIDIVKVNINEGNANRIKDTYPDIYPKVLEALNMVYESSNSSTAKKEITSIAIPKDVKTPTWINEFIDYTAIINDSLKNFPVEPMGITRLGCNNLNYTNIMSL